MPGISLEMSAPRKRKASAHSIGAGCPSSPSYTYRFSIPGGRGGSGTGGPPGTGGANGGPIIL